MDDKGNLYLVLKAAALLAAEGVLPVNVRLACDGEEETGGHSIVDFLVADERGADVCLVFDSGMPEVGVPAFDVATRGLAYFHVTARTGEHDLHSGIFGGSALNAIHALAASLGAVIALPEALRAGATEPVGRGAGGLGGSDAGRRGDRAGRRETARRRGRRGVLPANGCCCPRST